MPYRDDTARYEDERRPIYERSFFKGAVGVGAVAIAAIAGRKQIIRGLARLTGDEGLDVGGKYAKTQAFKMGLDITRTVNRRGAGWARGTLVHERLASTLKTGPYSSLAAIADITEGESRALSGVLYVKDRLRWAPKSIAPDTRLQGELQKAILEGNDALQTFLSSSKAGRDLYSLRSMEYYNRILGNKNLGRLHKMFAGVTGSTEVEKMSKRFGIIDDLVRAGYIKEEELAAGKKRIAEHVGKAVTDFVENHSGLVQSSFKQTWLERQLGIRKISVGEHVDRWLNSPARVVEAERRVAKRFGDDVEDFAEKVKTELQTQKERYRKQILGNVYGDDLTRIRAGRFVYVTDNDQILNLEKFGDWGTKARLWSDEYLSIPVAGFYPSRMLPWIPRKRQGSIHFYDQAGEGQVGYSVMKPGFFQIGKAAYDLEHDGAIAEGIAAEAHGIWARISRSLNASPQENKFHKAWGTQSVPSILGELKSIFTKHGDPDYAPTAYRMLRDGSFGDDALAKRKALGLMAEAIDANSLLDVSAYDDLVSRVVGSVLPEGVNGISQEGRRSVLNTLAGLSMEEKRNLGLGQGVINDLEQWQIRFANDTTTRQVSTNNLLGIFYEPFRTRALTKDEEYYQKLGKGILQSLVRGEDGLPTVGAYTDVLGSLTNPNSRRLLQSQFIGDFLSGRIRGDNGGVATGLIAEQNIINAMFGRQAQGSIAGLAGELFAGNDLDQYMSKLAWTSFNQAQVAESIRETTDPIFIKTGGKGFFKAIRERVGGKFDIENITTRSIAPWAMLERLNPMASRIGLGLSDEIIAQGPLGIASAITFKRILPLAAAGYGLAYLNDVSERTTGYGLDDAGMAARGAWNRGVIAVESVTGIRSINRWMKHNVAGFSNLQELPLVGGLLDSRTMEEYNEWEENGYDKVRSGRWWIAGSRTPIIGGRIKGWIPNAFRRVKSDWKDTGVSYTSEQFWSQAPIPTPEHPLAPLKHYWRNYSFEEIHKEDRPYPVSSQAFTERSWIGPILNSMFGKWLKPRRYHENLDRQTGLDTREVEAAYRYLRGERVPERFLSGNVVLEALKDGGITIGNVQPGEDQDFALPSKFSRFGDLTLPPDQEPLVGAPAGVWREMVGDTRAVQGRIIYDRNGNQRFLIGTESLSVGQMMLGGGGAGLSADALPNPNLIPQGNLGISVPKAQSSKPMGRLVSVPNAPMSIGQYLAQRLFGPVRNQPVYVPVEGEITPRDLLARYTASEQVPGVESLYNKNVQVPSRVRNVDSFRHHLLLASRSAEDITGIYGFATSSLLEKFGIDRTGQYNEYELATPEDAVSPAELYWRSEIGGLPGEELGSELGRRFVPRRSGQQRVWNPIRNTMPGWLPGPQDFTDFLHGDPYCVSPDTLIEIDGRLKRADQVEVGDKITTHKGRKLPVVGVFPRSLERGEKAYRITVASLPALPFVASEEHPILVAPRGVNALKSKLERANKVIEALNDRPLTRAQAVALVEAPTSQSYEAVNALIEDGKVLFHGRQVPLEVVDSIPYDVDHVCDPDWVEVQDIKVGDYVAYPIPSREAPYTIVPPNAGSWKQLPAEIVVDGDFARLCGYWVAEGSRDAWSLHLAFHESEGHFREDIGSILDRRFGLTAKWSEVRGSCVSGYICSKQLADLMESLFDRGARNKQLPDWWLDLPRDVLIEFLKGYLGGDGCHFVSGPRGRVSLKTTSLQLAYQIRLILLKLGVVANIVEGAPQESEHQGTTICSGVSYNVSANGRSSSVLRKLLGYPTHETYGRNTEHWTIDGSYLLLRVESVEEADAPYVIGFEVPEDDSFCVAGVATHNTKGLGFEYLLPGKAREAMFGKPDLGLSHPSGTMLGDDLETTIQSLMNQTSYRDRDEESDATREGTAIHAAFQKIYKRQGRLIAAEQHIRVGDITGLVDAIIRTREGAYPVEIKTKTTKKLTAMTAPDEKHISQLNLYLEALGANQGAIYYTSREDPTLSKVFHIKHDHERFLRDVAVVRQAQAEIRRRIASGEMPESELYSNFEKWKTLSFVAPFSDQYRFLDRKIQKSYKDGDLSEEDWKEYIQLRSMAKQRSIRKEMFAYQYSGNRAETDTVHVSEIVGPGRFRVFGDERIYQLAGVDLQLLAAEGGRKVEHTEDDQRNEFTKAQEELGLYVGARLKIVSDGTTQLGARGKEVVDASAWYRGRNISRELIERGFAQAQEEWTVADRDVAGRRWSPVKFFLERLTHLDTMFHTKVSNIRSPGEEWDRAYIYGAQYGRWETPVQDYVKPILWSMMNRNPIEGALRGAGIALTTKLALIDQKVIREAWNSTTGMKLKERLVEVGRRYLRGNKFTAAKVGAVIGLAASLLGKTPLMGTRQGDRQVPTERARQYQMEEYWDKIKYVKHHMYSQAYMRSALEREGRVLQMLLHQLQTQPGVKREIWKLYEQKKAIYDKDPRSKEIRKINAKISRLTQVSTQERLGDDLRLAALHESAARRTAYGADPKQLSEVIGGMPSYARQVLIAGSKTPDDQKRIWATLPKYLRESMWKLYGRSEVKKESLEDYFTKHSLPGPDWAGWQEEVNVQDLRNRYVSENNPGLNPLEMGVWPQSLRDAKDRIGNIPLPRMRTTNSHSDVRITIRRLLEHAGLEVKSVRLTPGEGQVNVRVQQDRTQEAVQYL